MAARVIWPAVQVAVGHRVHQVSRGGFLPEGVSEEDRARLVARGMVVEETPVIDDGAELAEGVPVVDAEAPTVKAEPADNEPVKSEKPQARKPAAK